MTRRIAAAALSLSLVAAAPPKTVIDVMPEFWKFWDEAQASGGGKDTGDPAQRVRRFRELVIAPHQKFYDEVIKVPDDARLATYLDQLAAAAPALRRVSAAFPGQLERAMETFTKAYPDFDRSIPIFLAPSLYTSSGQVRTLEGRWVIFYGLDVIAVILGERDDWTVDIHHEMFHAYHYLKNPEIAEAARSFFTPGKTSPLYYNLWSEGMAVYAARRLNPGAPLAHLLSFESLAREAPPLLPRLAREIRERLDSTDPNDERDYFFLGGKRPGVPPRSAYYVGLRVAETLATRFTQEQLVRLHGKGLRGEIARALETLEEGTPARPGGRGEGPE
jgi:hypothetical protein